LYHGASPATDEVLVKKKGKQDRKAGSRAAQYVRMSTDHQKYSTENQADIIALYAEEKELSIVCTYADEGRSGLNIAGRGALQQLIQDVQSGAADFDHILVYDISRWGRFQDADESAHYEFICRERGIQVHYCAEQFDNDGSFQANMIKTVKRMMAGEYSRELSAKVFKGQCRLITLGYRQGGHAGYGLRRHLVNERNEMKAPLARGEQKSLQTDRVILVLGPPEEVATVQRIYMLFVVEHRSEREIAELLNREGIRTDLDRPWNRAVVRQILTNEKYIGNNVYNRVSAKLKQKPKVNEPEEWVRGDGAFEALVDPNIFIVAQRIMAERARRFSDEELLSFLNNLLASRGALSGMMIDEMEEMPSSAAYRHRFGSLTRAYRLIGYVPARDYRFLETNRVLRLMHPRVLEETQAEIERFGGTVTLDPRTDLLIVNGELTISIVLARCMVTPAGSFRWKIRLDSGLKPDITVVVRLSPGNKRPRDYYLLPWLDLGTSQGVRLAEDNGVDIDAYRSDTLDPLYHLTRRHSLVRAS
jgi:DNA invertase Pin-like site-specific DNA recombinase